MNEEGEGRERVFLVWWHEPYELSEVLGVFSSEEKAKEWVRATPILGPDTVYGAHGG